MFKWNKICFPDTQKCHYFCGTNRTTCWHLHVTRWSRWDGFCSVSDSQSPGPSISVIFPLRFVMACIMTLFTHFFLMSEKLREWRRKANHYQKMACWVRCREGVCALSNSRPGTKISSNAALSLSVMSTLECTDYGWNSREIQTVLAVSNRTET